MGLWLISCWKWLLINFNQLKCHIAFQTQMIYYSDDDWNERIASRSDHLLMICLKTLYHFFCKLMLFNSSVSMIKNWKICLKTNRIDPLFELLLMRIIFSLQRSITNGLKEIFFLFSCFFLRCKQQEPRRSFLYRTKRPCHEMETSFGVRFCNGCTSNRAEPRRKCLSRPRNQWQ